MPPFVRSRAAFADYFLPVMPPLVHDGGICGFFSTSYAATSTQRRHLRIFLPVMPPFVHRYSRAAFADYFLPVMPPFVHSRAAFADYFLPVMPPFVHRYSRAAFADFFLPVMPPFVHRYSRAAFADYFLPVGFQYLVFQDFHAHALEIY